MAATPLDEIRTRLRELEVDVALAQTEGRTNVATLATSLRRTKANLVIDAAAQDRQRVRQSANLVNWDPRAGLATDPDLAQSLIDRLRKGVAVSDTLGNTSPFFGKANLLADPTFETINGADITSTAELQVGASWFVFVDDLTIDSSVERVPNSNSAFNGAGVSLLQDPVPPDASSHDLVLRSESMFIPDNAPYVVASIRVAKLQNDFDNTGNDESASVTTLELYDVTDNVVRGSRTIIPGVILPNGVEEDPSYLIWCAVEILGTAWAGHPFQVRVRQTCVTTGGGGGDAMYSWSYGEPQVQASYVSDPSPYTPLIANWYPTAVKSRLWGQEGEPSFNIIESDDPSHGTDAPTFAVDQRGVLLWNHGGVGSTPNTALYTTEPGELVLDGGGPATGRGVLQFGGGSAPAAPTNDYGSLYFNLGTHSFHQVDEFGTDTDLAGGGLGTAGAFDLYLINRMI